MKFVVLIHSNPDPWGHPTHEFTEQGRAIPREEKERSGREFDAFLEELHAAGELVTAEALAAPAASTVYRWADGPVASEGPYAETTEHLAGFFLIDVADRARAEEVARRFAGAGDTIELRPAMWGGGED
ncbi:YciI family protein [Lapillicoccus jejuensis]|uniref:YCII-related domain-containing protein n=1 Tax=Lapillicoccus jejuensis TaxID=402171 RepID=A0A542DZN3_9MICO|nr:YciI family protein [Lapillicoccus jejuensis]TQJ08536.1 hypothetical protein FB458_1626 [Lapillicoccus jejuensis]